MNSTSAEPEAIDTPQSDELKRWSTIQSGDVPVDGRSLSSEERKRSFKGKNDGNTGVDLTKPMDSKTYSNKSSSSSLSSKDASGSSGVFAETQKVHLLSPDDQSLVVARGEVVKIYPTDEVWGTKLGRRFVGVRVDEILDAEEELIRPYEQYREIGDSKGQIIAWQKIYVKCV